MAGCGAESVLIRAECLGNVPGAPWRRRSEPLGIPRTAWCQCVSSVAPKQGAGSPSVCLTATEFDFHFKLPFCWVIETKLQPVLGFLWHYAEQYEMAAVWSFLSKNWQLCMVPVYFSSIAPRAVPTLQGLTWRRGTRGRAVMCGSHLVPGHWTVCHAPEVSSPF